MKRTGVLGTVKQDVLVFDVDTASCGAAADILKPFFDVYPVRSTEEARAVLGARPNLAVVLAERGSADEGIAFLRGVRTISRAERLLVSPRGDFASVIEAVNDGTLFGCVARPWNKDELAATVRRAAEHHARTDAVKGELRLFRDLLESLPDGVYFKDRNFRYIEMNSAAVRYLGLERPEQALGRTAEEVLPAEFGRLGREEDERVLNEGVTITDRVRRWSSADGVSRWTSTTKAPVLDDDGRPHRIVCVVRDVTERLRAETENALLIQVARTIQAAPDVETALANVVGSICKRMEWPYGEAWRSVDGGEELAICHGWSNADPRTRLFSEFSENYRFKIGEGLLGRVWQSRSAESIEDVSTADPSVFRRHRVALECGLRSVLAVPVIGEDEDCLAVLVFFAFEKGVFADERLTGTIGAVAAQLGLLLDRRSSEDALRESEQRFRDFSDIASDYLTESGPDYRITYVSENFLKACGRRAEEVLGHTRWELDWLELEAENSWPNLEKRFRNHLSFREFRYWMRRPDGERLCLLANGKPFFDSQGGFAGYRTTGRNVTEEIRREISLREKQHLIENIIESIPQYVFWKDRSSTFVGCNTRFAQFLGFDAPEDLIGKTDFDLGVPDENAEFFRSIDAKVMGTGEPILDLEEKLEKADGGTFILRTSKVPLRDKEGTVIGMLGVFADITEHRQLTAQLNHIQKMDAVGQLTGGIAHDFNNLLTVIIGNLQLLERSPDMDERCRSLARRALGSAQRGGDLTRRLLAFSRRQVLEPTVVDVNAMVAEIGPLMRRTLGENIEVAVISHDAGLCARMDVSQFETSLLNLAINARDAMPHGGKLTIEIAKKNLSDSYSMNHLEVEPGNYIQIAVTDTGTGIPPDVLEHVFEPFFTTKEIGKGTGLGLSMIYGFVKQSGGHVSVYSEVGIGTTVRMYFPQTDEPAHAAEPDNAGELDTSGEETVLIVEDNLDVRMTVTLTLRGLGYRILQAGSGAEALEVLERNAPVHLMITDVVMPGGMNGPQLAEQVRTRWPATKLLMMSGYPREALSRNGTMTSDVSFISKPFRNQDLARRVRELLETKGAAARPS
ncbi:MAG: PAS domain-containing protein [Alphaproteobacteria bacterium]